MIQKWICCIFCILALIGCKPESPLSPINNQQDSEQPYSYIDKQEFTLYVDNTYDVDQDITIYMRPWGWVVWDYFMYEGLHSVGIACGGECTEIGIFACDSLTYLTGMYAWEIGEMTFEGRYTEDALDTRGMSEYTWVFDEQTRWFIFTVVFPVGIEE